MAKRIDFIAPVDAMRGNLSGDQTLEYAQNNNPAYDAPVGLNYARNYQTRYIGAKRAASGLKYFSVKTKAATLITNRSKMVMALLGGTGAVRAAIKALAGDDILNIYRRAKELGMTDAKTYDKYLYDTIYAALESKNTMISFFATGATPQSVAIRNPWVYTNQTGGVPITIKNSILVKFWAMLAKNPIFFDVEGMRGVAHAADTFQNVIDRSYNVLNLQAVPAAQPSVVGFSGGQSFIQYEGSYVEVTNTVQGGGSYTITFDPPTA